MSVSLSKILLHFIVHIGTVFLIGKPLTQVITTKTPCICQTHPFRKRGPCHEEKGKLSQ